MIKLPKKIYAENRQARFDYEILKSFDAGIVLTGQEVKSIKSGRITIAGAIVGFTAGRPVLLNADIPPYQPKNLIGEYNSKRPRQLLLEKREIVELFDRSQERGLTVIPISVYNKGDLVKVEIALARRRKKSDKREAIKKREVKREIKRTVR